MFTQKITGILASVLVLVWLFAVVSVSAQEQIVLRFADVPGFAYTQAIEEYFGPLYEELTGVKVEMEVLEAGAQRDKMLMEAIGGTGYYHLGYLSPGWHGMFTENVLDLNPFIEEYDFDISQYPPLVWESHAVPDIAPDMVVAIPHAVNAGFMCYRMDWFDHPEEKQAFEAEYGYELAPPETWVQMYDVARFFTRDAGETLAGKTLENSVFGFAESYRHPESAGRVILPHVVYGMGFDVFDENFRPDIDDPRVLEATEFFMKILKETCPPGAVNWDFTDHLEYFRDSRAAMAVMYSGAVHYVESDVGESPGNTGYAVLPRWENNLKGFTQGTHILGGGGIMIFDTPYAEEAWKFLQWIAEDQEIEWIRRTSNFARLAHFEDEVLVEQNPYYEYFLPVYLQALENQYLRQGIPEYTEAVWNASADFFTDVLGEVLTPEAALDRWVNTVERVFDRAGYYD